MMYSLHRAGTDPEVIKNLAREVDDVVQDKLPSYETYKHQKYAEAWYEKPVLIDVTKKLVPFFFFFFLQSLIAIAIFFFCLVMLG